MSEYLSGDGVGISRESALVHADLQAAAYFDIDVSEISQLDRALGRATVTMKIDGSVDLCGINAEYRNPQD